MCKDAKIPDKTLARQIQEDIKRITHYNWMQFILGMQEWLSIWKSISVVYTTLTERKL